MILPLGGTMRNPLGAVISLGEGDGESGVASAFRINSPIAAPRVIPFAEA